MPGRRQGHSGSEQKFNVKIQAIMNRVKEAALLAIGLVVLGLCIKWGIDDFANKDRTVTVKGLAEKEVAADKVTWPIQTKELGDDLPSLYTKINATTDKVKRFLKQNGVKDEEISVNAPRWLT